MPHVIIEYSDVLEAQVPRRELLKAVHQAVSDSGLFDLTAIRSRTQSYDNYIVGSGSHNFLHVTIKLLSGRTDEQKSMLTHGVFVALKSLPISDVNASCECIDIHNNSYKKVGL